MKLIIGLGNPDTKYQNTRHNLGRMIIENFIQQHKLSLKKISKLSAQLSECRNGLEPARRDGFPFSKTIIGFTSEYMNNSGVAVSKIAQFYKINPDDIYIVHDDLDLPVGEYKIQFDRGPAGHNGVKSIVDHLGTQAFNRIRVGIGKSDNIPIEDYVLLHFTKAERDIINDIIPKVVQELEKIIEN
ncbi:MAG: aminoacyl-tRNA hydrolase [Candidatus Shapirobacteria bacterium]|nr:aminoacyl-tRNA hydrolase [Candidatus Shapirobacteria bacterium]